MGGYLYNYKKKWGKFIMLCANCGAKIKDENLFCNKCGARLNKKNVEAIDNNYTISTYSGFNNMFILWLQ